MILISHRGNTSGKIEDKENEPNYINLSINNGFDVEIDIWYVNSKLYLGHDMPQYEIHMDWLKQRIDKLWIHCKNIDAVIYFKQCKDNFNFFWHQKDDITLTSLNYIWAFPGKQPIQNSISVLPELHDDSLISCIGICSDIIEKYRKIYEYK